MRIPAPEIVTVTTRRIACDGNDAVGLGHPRVWLAIPAEVGFVDCGYCDKRFVLDSNNANGDH
ncbi:zinc-finger domain-containing protein [Paracoccus alkanivorans]|uniref:Zinc-finger domain-containing protein n=1 Tax=Paracoccus alkanivorans TaxID=2116655 RepID=A0A3M0MP20_9RHOB|nr:zinc-finger domain-containing protein [Paracoccus alkanivorans]RMC38064.1 zinc-finger domain-containing protein [Paracoccus alkanivorans]